MSHGNRPTLGDLLLKDRNHTAIAAQYIAESDTHKTGIVTLQSQNNQLCDPLGSAHDVRGIYCFVGRNENEIPRAELAGYERYIVCAENVVRHRLEAIVLHQRNMLVRRCMKHRLRPVVGEDIA
jgi:hypothetical protein